VWAIRLSWVVLGLIGLRGVIGYAQYFSGLPGRPGLRARRRYRADLDRGAPADLRAARPGHRAGIGDQPVPAAPQVAEPASQALPGDAQVR